MAAPARPPLGAQVYAARAGDMVTRIQKAPPAGTVGSVTDDTNAFGTLVREHEAVAFRVAYLMTGRAAEAEDVVQDAAIKALRAFPRFRAGADFRPWFLQIVANEARNRRRAAGRREAATARLTLEVATDVSRNDPEEMALSGERRAALLSTVNALNERDKLVLVCRYFMNLTEKETATVLAVRRGTVKSRTSRALKRIRAVLDREGSDVAGE